MSGFARTLQRTSLGDPEDKYVEMMVAASNQLAELLEDVGLVARIESGRWEPNVQEVDSLELARSAAGAVEGARADGSGAPVRVDRDAAETALTAARALRAAPRRPAGARRDRRGGGDRDRADHRGCSADPARRQQARDLGALIARRIVAALGGSIELEGDRLVVRLPA